MRLYIILSKKPLQAIKLPLRLVRWLVARKEIKAYRLHERIIANYVAYFKDYPDIKMVLDNLHGEIKGPGAFKNPNDFLDTVVNLHALKKKLKQK